MFKNYFIIAIRTLTKNKLFTAINVFGLAFGLALCILILGNINYELSFEDIHKNKDRIFRLNGSYYSQDNETHSAQVMGALGKAVKEELAEVDNAAIFRMHDLDAVEIDEQRFTIHDKYRNHAYAHGRNIIFADSEFFSVFSHELLIGNPNTALEQPFTAIISQETAEEYFYGIDPVGQHVKLNDQFECEVVGVLKEIPQNTQIYCDFLVSYSTLERIGYNTASWDNFGEDYVYLLLAKGVDYKAAAGKIAPIVKKNLELKESEEYIFTLQPLKKIYFSSLGSTWSGELKPMGEASVIYTFGIIALFILIQAVANFINLSTARSADRMKEVGVRKVFGAFKWNLMKQFLGESLIIAFISMMISLFIFEIVKFSVEDALPREMLIDFYGNPAMVLSIIGLVIFVGIFAGFYPAFYLSKFNPLAVLQGNKSAKSTKSLLRKVLVVFQFSLAIVFIVSTIILYNQINHMLSINLGFDKENILLIDFEGENAAYKSNLMKNEILTKTNATFASASSGFPGTRTYQFNGIYTSEERKHEDMVVGRLFYTDYDFLDMYGLEIIQGRQFDESIPEEMAHTVIVNESTVKELGLENPIGHKLYRKNNFLEIVGVVKDFHGSTLDWGYKSMLFMVLNQDKTTSLAVKLPPGQIPESLASIKNIWKELVPNEEFSHKFLDEEIDSNYNGIRSQGNIFLAFALLTIIIACLGIFGLVSYTSEQRTKEIGIRKVLGSSINGIIALLSKEFVFLVIIANVIGAPIAYLMMSAILQEFPFRANIGPAIFIFAGLLTLLLALSTTGWQAYKAAAADPIKTLRYE